jgi:peptide/nickel transport system permease protein
MIRLILYRLLLAVPQLLVVSVLVFLLVYLIPGSPVTAVLGPNANPDQIREVEAALGFDKPFGVRLVDYIGGLLQGDLGTSLDRASFGRPVGDLIVPQIPATLSLVGGGFVVSLVVGVTMGMLAGTRAGSVRDKVTVTLTSLGQAIPPFFMGVLLIFVFIIELGWFRVVAWYPPDRNLGLWFSGLVLPALALGLAGSTLIARQTRSAIAEALSSRYVDTLTAAGTPRWRIVWVYAFKNALVPVLAASGITIGILFGTSLVIERVFSFPGLGTSLLGAVTGKDFPLLQGGALVLAVMIIVVNLFVDIAYALLNPKARPS